MNKFIMLCFSLSLCFIACTSPKQNEAVRLEELTIADIHQSFENKEYNSEQLVQAYLDRISQVDTDLNALTYINPDALEIARKLDDEYAETNRLRPLHGIPLVVKDNINTQGMPTTAGSLALENFVAEQDAFIIQKLLDAGAIILAKSNMAEWAFSPMHTESSTAGTTHNPYNPDYVPAGSSGGTAAAIAANLGIIGLGTDTGNSIRGPSSHCALVGFRTTLGLVSRSAIVPLYLRNDVVGPMCRTVEDATRVLEVIAGEDPADPLTAYAEGKIPGNYQQYLQKDGLEGARIGVLRTLSENEPDPEIHALFEQAISDLDSLGAIIVDTLVIPDFDSLRQNQWCAAFREDLETFLATYVRSDTLKTLEDIIRIGTKSEFAQGRLERQAENRGRYEEPEVPCLNPYEDERRIAFRTAIERVMDSLQVDAIIYPSWNHPPAHIERFSEEYEGDNSQIIAPHTGQPAFTVPMGYTEGNLPAGLQFLGRMYDEPTLIKLMYAYEQATQHRKAPKLLE
ncbi:amidase [Catalinimonas alkaloidigena]|uniref:amidase n=1 Tax=Catalinimonas alkaloidigena TaxID=1075417 RepID=UPI002406F0C3|nr:amidase [Catalinimonas alkaloidigena]MDF9795419.1 amidase [Catalinimonas alkaloidigena]